MRDRLIELLKSVPHGINTFGEVTESLYIENVMAEHLLKNGIIVPPCKVGDMVYFVARNSGRPIGSILPVEIVMIGKTESGFCAQGKIGENTFDVIPHFEIDNYTFFASREEAEKALKGGVE